MKDRFKTLYDLTVTDLPNMSCEVVIRYYPKGWSNIYNQKSTITREAIRTLGRNDAILMECQNICAKAYTKDWIKEQLWEEVKIVLKERFNIE